MNRVIIVFSALVFLLSCTGKQADLKNDRQAGSDKQVNEYFNPIIQGFYPDPSICRVGEDYYMAHSSFEYFQGVPIFHSKDLIHWEQIGHALTRKSQLNLDTVPASRGIYASTLRFHNDTFYMITTNTIHGGNFVVHTANPYGEWSGSV